jgi:hypothetical protein
MTTATWRTSAARRHFAVKGRELADAVSATVESLAAIG